MNPSLASLAYALGIAGLFYLNRDTSIRTSKALWIPVIWYWIAGSRSISVWLGGGPATADQQAEMMMDGNPSDRLFFFILLAVALTIVARRGRISLLLIAANWPIALYYSYCLLSVTWSDFPDASVRRWIKATADVVMPLVVVTDRQPIAAMRRLFSRVGFVILPGSVLFIKYYPQLGRTYDAWTGEASNTGLATNKNLLGVITFTLALGALWQVLLLWRNSTVENRTRQLVAQCTALGFGIWLLINAHSATSGICFAFAAGLMLLTALRRIRGRPSAVHRLVVMFLLIGVFLKFTGTDTDVVHGIGRNADLTGRTDIWALVIPMAPNAVVGAGFESFWLGPRLLQVWTEFPYLRPNEAHNGYIEVYLNLGLVGLGLVALVLINGYRRSVGAFRVDPKSASLMLAFVLCSVIYSYTEAGFRMLSLTWCFVFLVTLAASRISGLATDRAIKQGVPRTKRASSATPSDLAGRGTSYGHPEPDGPARNAGEPSACELVLKRESSSGL